jgi:hypothetical protein
LPGRGELAGIDWRGAVLLALAFNAHVIGAVIAVMALLALFAFKTWEEWISGVLGAWLVISPSVLGFSAAARRRSLIC